MRDRFGWWPEHEAHMRLQGLSTHTVAARRGALDRLSRVVDVADVTYDDVAGWLGDANLSVESKAAYASQLRSFYGWAVRRGHVGVDPTDGLPAFKARRRLPNPTAEDDLARALDAASPRMRAWLLLGCYAGLRCMEIAQVRDRDIRPGGLLVVHGKGGQTRIVPLHPTVLDALEPFRGSGPPGWLFPSTRRAGQPVVAYTVSVAIGNHFRSLGIASTAHKLRHRAGTDALAATGNLRAVQEFLGHASPTTTAIYTKLLPDDLSRLVHALPPR